MFRLLSKEKLIENCDFVIALPSLFLFLSNTWIYIISGRILQNSEDVHQMKNEKRKRSKLYWMTFYNSTHTTHTRHSRHSDALTGFEF